jgi:hypothetical protein
MQGRATLRHEARGGEEGAPAVAARVGDMASGARRGARGGLPRGGSASPETSYFGGGRLMKVQWPRDVRAGMGDPDAKTSWTSRGGARAALSSPVALHLPMFDQGYLQKFKLKCTKS